VTFNLSAFIATRFRAITTFKFLTTTFTTFHIYKNFYKTAIIKVVTIVVTKLW